MTRNWLYQNKKNLNKFIEVRRYADGHYVWKQYIETQTSLSSKVINYTGCSLKRVKKGVWQRVSKKRTMLEVLADYNWVA